MFAISKQTISDKKNESNPNIYAFLEMKHIESINIMMTTTFVHVLFQYNGNYLFY